jgi:1-acyl-sn-glycerol-3-phosphate acyltransferase
LCLQWITPNDTLITRTWDPRDPFEQAPSEGAPTVHELLHRFGQLWRVLRTGLGFVVFGVSSIALSLSVIPLLWLISSSVEQRELRIQYLLHLSFRYFLWVLKSLGLARVHRAGVEALSVPGTLVVVNHPTLVDVIAVIAHMPQADCVVKATHFSNPFYRGMLHGAGYLPNFGGEALVEACVERLRSGRSLVFFPEGTRSPEGGLGRFQRGAAHIALAARSEVLPVLLTCDPPTLMKGQPWYHVPERPFHLGVRVGEPFAIEEYAALGSRARASRALTADLRGYFEKCLARAGAASPKSPLDEPTGHEGRAPLRARRLARTNSR